MTPRCHWLMVAVALAAAGCDGRPGTVVGSKVDPESELLAEMGAQFAGTDGGTARHRAGLGGTAVLWDALAAGELDAYPEFTGTLAFEVFRDPSLADADKLRAALAGRGVGVTRPLGFENNYAIGVRADVADRLGLRTVSDLAAHPDLRLGFSNEFAVRADGWPGLRRAYRLPHREPGSMEHAIAYAALAANAIDATDVYTTDPEIEQLGLRVLTDDRNYFPRYAAVFVYRLDWAERNPAARAALRRLEGSLDEGAVRRMNGRMRPGADSPGRPSEVAADFLHDRFGVSPTAPEESVARRLLRYTGEHLYLVAVSLSAAVALAIPLGVLAARRPRAGRVVVGLTSLVQTIPSLALLVFLVAYFGKLGPRPAILALFLYSLLPVVRNTAAGLSDIPPSLREAADGLGLTAWQKLRLVELPLASRSILAGVKTAAVINVGTATLGALIDAGGLGVPIQQGLRTNDARLLLLGAVPAALLALLAELGFDLLERVVVPKGLRLGPAR